MNIPSKSLGILIAGLLIVTLAVGVALWRQPPRSASSAEDVTVIQLTVVHNALVGKTEYQVPHGGRVRIEIRGSGGQREAELTITGYNLRTSVENNNVASFDFTATTAGSFPIVLSGEPGEKLDPATRSEDEELGSKVVQAGRLVVR